MANLSRTLRINFYQNRSSVVEVVIKKNFGVFFMPHSVVLLKQRSSVASFSSFFFCLTDCVLLVLVKWILVIRFVIELESTQRVQTSAEDVHVLFLAVYRNRNSK